MTVRHVHAADTCTAQRPTSLSVGAGDTSIITVVCKSQGRCKAAAIMMCKSPCETRVRSSTMLHRSTSLSTYSTWCRSRRVSTRHTQRHACTMPAAACDRRRCWDPQTAEIAVSAPCTRVHLKGLCLKIIGVYTVMEYCTLVKFSSV